MLFTESSLPQTDSNTVYLKQSMPFKNTRMSVPPNNHYLSKFKQYNYKIPVPVRPAPATPNREPIMAMPAVDPRAAALAPPRNVPTPAPIRGAAAKPPVSPNTAPPPSVAKPIRA